MVPVCSLAAAVAFALASLSPSSALADQGQADAQHHGVTNGAQTNELVKVVRDSTERFRQVTAAGNEGYVQQFGCVTGSSEGAMGVHFVNFPLVGNPALDPKQPEALVYEPLADGRMRLVAVEYLVLADSWHAQNPGPPELMGQLFHFNDSPNRFGLPAFYALHVWAWKENPQGTFANWNPNVSCDGFNPR
jgi:hypothetical protein